jgi:hypothetical protein
MDLYNALHFKNRISKRFKISRLKNPPRLLSVPPFHHELTIKANISGITVLKESRYRKRYVGSKQSAVDINGKIYLKASDLKKVNEIQDKKRIRAKNSADRKKTDFEDSTSQDKKVDRLYKIHKTEIRNRILGMINTMSGRKELYFWTISFPEKTPDDVAYRLFNIWLTTLRQKKWLRNYLWIAERQENGTIHYHLAIPHRLSVVAANNAMRTILRTAAKRNELINFNVYQCRRYNGVDIAKNRKTRRVTNFANKKGSRSLASYLSKYVTKNDATFTHLAWHNSRGYSALFTGITFTTTEFINYGFRSLVKPTAIINNEYFLFFAWLEDPPRAITRHLFDLNSFIQDPNGDAERTQAERN